MENSSLSNDPNLAINFQIINEKRKLEKKYNKMQTHLNKIKKDLTDVRQKYDFQKYHNAVLQGKNQTLQDENQELRKQQWFKQNHQLQLNGSCRKYTPYNSPSFCEKNSDKKFQYPTLSNNNNQVLNIEEIIEDKPPLLVCNAPNGQQKHNSLTNEQASNIPNEDKYLFSVFRYNTSDRQQKHNSLTNKQAPTIPNENKLPLLVYNTQNGQQKNNSLLTKF